MDKERAILTIISEFGTKQEIPLSHCIVGGFMGDGSGVPMGAYVGDLDIMKIGVSFEHIVRAYIKLCNEQGQFKEDSHIRSLMNFCIDRAFETEEKNDPDDNVDIDTHTYIYRHDRSKGIQ
jgi:hypothetical protein